MAGVRDYLPRGWIVWAAVLFIMQVPVSNSSPSMLFGALGRSLIIAWLACWVYGKLRGGGEEQESEQSPAVDAE